MCLVKTFVYGKLTEHFIQWERYAVSQNGMFSCLPLHKSLGWYELNTLFLELFLCITAFFFLHVWP